MKVKIEPTMTWKEAPDVISHIELAKILGVGPASARKIFERKDFPKIDGIGYLIKADKEAVRLYLQGVNMKTNSKEILLTQILFELKQLNSAIAGEGGTNENIEDII